MPFEMAEEVKESNSAKKRQQFYDEIAPISQSGIANYFPQTDFESTQNQISVDDVYQLLHVKS